MRTLASLRLLALTAALSAFTIGCKPDEPPPPPPTPECTVDTDCTGALTVCQRHVCAAGVCTVAFRPVGTRLDAQTMGDCQVAVCGQNGEPTNTPDDADLPNDGNECTTDVCTAGFPSHGNVAADTACGAGGALKCDGAGKCVTCTTANDCAAGSSCQAPACVDGACSLTNLARGTKLATQTAGDCKAVQCDGQGATETIDDNADVPVDTTTCTTDVCTNGTPSNPPATVRTACSEGNGLMCDGAGACVQCVMASDCPGFDTECNVRTCTAGVCGRRFTADNTPVAAQTANDCKKVVCDGQGRVVTRNDDSDTPNDNNLCTVDTCNNGAPVITNATAGTTCGTSLVCNGTGGCVGCNTAADCPGTDNECSTRTCVSNLCGRTYAPNNTPATTQTANDCKKRVCDGSGNIVSVNDNADIPLDDNNQCTSQSCSNGQPVWPTVALNTACTQNGGAFCSAGGQCVQCNAATQCAGTDSECSQRTCTAGACGRTFQPIGTPTTTGQVTGDCKQVQCAGDGGLQSAVLDTDLPAPNGNQCQTPSCNAGVSSYAPTALNSTCNQDGGTFCNGAGACVQCNADVQCSGTSTECATRLCTTGACTWRYVDAGIATTAQVTGDCKQTQCAGDGGFLAVALDTDFPVDDGNQCTSQSCSSGTPTFPAVTPGSLCSQDGGTVCSGTACVECITAADCPGSDTACTFKTCTANRCGVANRPSGYTTGLTQTSNDCQQAQCDGNGAITLVADATDPLADDGNQCTEEYCNGTTPDRRPRPLDFTCSQNGGTRCNGAATVVASACVECTAATQCPGTDGECATRTCTAGACGMNYPNNTPIAAQTARDCQVVVCDGTGGTTSIADNSDVPAADTNQCTFERCSNGAVATGNEPAGTGCNQNGGTVCDGSGVCGSCLADDDCPNGNECQVRKCTAGACGFVGVTAGTPLATQTANDCKTAVCDGTSTGGTTFEANTADLPLDDAFECTVAACNGATPEQQPKANTVACTENGGSWCDGAGTCVQCNQAAQCGSNTECLTRTCTNHVCGATYTDANTALASQTANDCKTVVCDGSGGTTVIANSTDYPLDDGLECTSETCNGTDPAHPVVPLDTACGPTLGKFCAASGQCVSCNVASQCSGTDTFCQVRTCSTAGVCGVSNTADETPLPLASQEAGDCQTLVCFGGATASRVSDSDKPTDSKECTTDDCSNGTKTFTNVSSGVACTEGGGHVCDGAGVCIGCLTAADCPATGTECVINTCSNNTCGTENRASGYVLVAQSSGDCKQAQCDGSGAVMQVADATDPFIDANQCTDNLCSGSTPSNPSLPFGAPCTQNGGDVCNGNGTCVVSPVVASVVPANGATGVAVASTIAITFNKAMSSSSLTVQSTAGACSGNVQLSRDDFTSCLGLGTAAMTVGNTVATFTPVVGLAFGTNYKVRVTTGALDSGNIPLKSQFTMVDGFTTGADTRYAASGVVISQVYANGGNSGATYTHDYVELHNRGASAVNVAGYTLQYAGTSTFALAATLPAGASIPPGGFYLVRLATGGANGIAPPAPDATGTTNIGGNGKVALVTTNTLVASTCLGTGVVDLVGMGTASCYEGASATGAQSATTAVFRKLQGCVDTNVNGSDFEVLAPSPRNSATAAFECSATLNETGLGGELDYCALYDPTSISATVATGSTLVKARVYEAGSTEAAGAAVNLQAQIGYGPASSNPQWQTGWIWTNAAFSAQVGNDEEWTATLNTPATAGSYRYTARFSWDGANWTYCDLNGAGSNANLWFETAQLPTLTVTP